MTDWDEGMAARPTSTAILIPASWTSSDFIDTWKTRGEALDLGCGQGRDSLYLARAGYEVTSVDGSAPAIAQLLDRADGLALRGVVSDIRDYTLGFVEIQRELMMAEQA